MDAQASRQISVVIGRFEDLVGLGLRALVSQDPSIDIVAADVSAERYADVLEALDPRVALVNFGSLASPIVVHELHTRFPATRLVVLANRPTAVESTQLLAFGATACLAKDVEGRDVLNAIHLASRGLQVLPRHGVTSGDPLPGPDLLTPREADVLEHLQAGHANGEIAAALHVGVETVRTHVRNIYRKLGVASRRELELGARGAAARRARG